MKILVTGASGRVGKNLVTKLVEENHKVKCLVISEKEAEKLKGLKVDIIYGNLTDFKTLIEAIKEVEIVYHLGALLPGVTGDPSSLFDVNVKGTFNILEATAKYGDKIERFIFASTDDTYPVLSPLYLPVDENHPQIPNSLYGASKLIGEKLCFTYQRQYGIPVVCCRFAFVIGIGEILDPNYFLFFLSKMIEIFRSQREQSQEIDRSFQILEKLWNGKDKLLIPYDKSGRPYRVHPVDVRDLVKGLVLAMEKESAKGESFNLAGPASFSFDEAIKYVSHATGIPYLEVELPAKPINYEISISKSKGMLGYNPQYDVFAMIDSAIKKK